VTEDAESKPQPCQASFTRKIRFEPGKALAWVIESAN
jgi:hypothetical protein